MASGVGGSPADCIPAPWPSGPRLTRDQTGRAPCNLGFSRVVRFLCEGLPGKARRSEGKGARKGKGGRGMGRPMVQGLPTADHGRPWMALGVKPEARSAQRQPVTGRTGKQADRQASRWSGMQPVGGSSSGSSPDGCLMSPGLLTSRADRFPRRHAACHLCRHADMQTAMRAGGQIATITGRPQNCSGAAPQHYGCGNP